MQTDETTSKPQRNIRRLYILSLAGERHFDWSWYCLLWAFSVGPLCFILSPQQSASWLYNEILIQVWTACLFVQTKIVKE